MTTIKQQSVDHAKSCSESNPGHVARQPVAQPPRQLQSEVKTKPLTLKYLIIISNIQS